MIQIANIVPEGEDSELRQVWEDAYYGVGSIEYRMDRAAQEEWRCIAKANNYYVTGVDDEH